jgi:hypothetical protein
VLSIGYFKSATMPVKKNRNRSFNGVGGSFCTENENNDSGLYEDSETEARMDVSQLSSGPVSTKFVKL